MYQEEQVRRGIALLDEKLPDWHRTFDPSTLNVGSAAMCVLAQASGGEYADGLVLLGLSAREAPDYGFAILHIRLGNWVPESAKLTQTWIVLESRTRRSLGLEGVSPPESLASEEQEATDLPAQPSARELVLV